MKAQSSIGIHIQEPPKMMGMPPLHALMVLVGEIIGVMTVGSVLGSVWGFALFILTMPPAIAFIINLRRKEPHCEALLLQPMTFFGAKQARHLVAGHALKTPKKKRVKS